MFRVDTIDILYGRHPLVWKLSGLVVEILIDPLHWQPQFAIQQQSYKFTYQKMKTAQKNRKYMLVSILNLLINLQVKLRFFARQH